MTMFQIIDSRDVACRFVGERIVHIQCDMLEFADSHGWVELSAFAVEDQTWVVTIAIKRCEARLDDHIDMCVANNLDEVEAFLFDFGMSSVLADSFSAEAYYESAATMMMVQLRGINQVPPWSNRTEVFGLIHRLRTFMGFQQ